jgi:hypothetical protein
MRGLANAGADGEGRGVNMGRFVTYTQSLAVVFFSS